MPSELKCIIYGARNLPIMEKSRNTTDAYCELVFGQSAIRKTDTVYNNLAPVWQQMFIFENIDDEELQESVLKINVIDEDVISRDDLIGTVLVDLSSLMQSTQSSMSGWFPIFDVNKGLRGELNLEIKLMIIRDENRSSVNSVQFFSTADPPLFAVKHLICFVEELVDFKRKSDRSSDEADNMTLIQEACLKLRRKLSQAVTKRGGNSLIGYRQVLDNEGAKSKRIVVRGYGTAAFLEPIDEEELGGNSSQQIKKAPLKGIAGSKHGKIKEDTRSLPTAIEEKPKVQFITSSTYPQDAIIWFGSTVSARSVRLISQKTTERDSWWGELRHEITKNALSLNCTHILGYREVVNIYEDVMVLNVYGTAVKIKEYKLKKEQSASGVPLGSKISNTQLQRHNKQPADMSPQVDHTPALNKSISQAQVDLKNRAYSKVGQDLLLGQFQKYLAQSHTPSCNFFHVIHSKQQSIKDMIANKMNLFKCLECDRDWVPEIIIATIDPPEGINIIGTPKYLEARIVKNKKYLKGEQHAISVSEKVFFLEYHLHSQLIKKMKLFCKNAIFSLKITIIIANDIITGTASGTAVQLKALPIPMPLIIKKNPKLLHDNNQDNQFFSNLEQLSKFYIEQGLKSDVFKIHRPYPSFVNVNEKGHKLRDYMRLGASGVLPHQTSGNANELFILDQQFPTALPQSHSQPPLSTKKTPSKIEEEKVNATPFLGDFSLKRPLRTISEEVFKSTSVLDHNKIILQQMAPRDISEDVEIEKSETESNANTKLTKAGDKVNRASKINLDSLRRFSLDENKDGSWGVSGAAAALPGYQIEQATFEQENQRGKLSLLQGDIGNLSKLVEFYNNNDNFRQLMPTQTAYLEPRSPQIVPVGSGGAATGHQDYMDHLLENKILDSVNNQRQNYQLMGFPSSTSKTSFIIELDDTSIQKRFDNKELDLLKSLLDPFVPPSIVLLNTEFDLFNYQANESIQSANVRLVTKACRYVFEEREDTKINQAYSYLMQQAHLELVQAIIQQGLTPCVVCSLRHQVKIHDNHHVDIIFNAVVLKTVKHLMLDLYRQEKEQIQTRTDLRLPIEIKEALDEQGQRLGEDQKINIFDQSVGGTAFQILPRKPQPKRPGFFASLFRCTGNQNNASNVKRHEEENLVQAVNPKIKLLPISFCPGTIIKKYLGIVDVHVIRVLRVVQEQVPQLIEKVIAEVNQIASARVEALGGNCLLSMRIDVNTLEQTIQSQLYIVVSVFGDVVEVQTSESGEQQEMQLLQQETKNQLQLS